MKRSPTNKKIILINRDFQLRYTGIAVGIGTITTLLTTVVILTPLYIFEILRIPRFLPTPILVGMSAALILNIASLSFMGIMLTHRIAGPMYSIVRHLRRIAAGRWGLPMRLRDEDELKFVVRNVNDLVQSLTEIALSDIRALQTAISVLESAPDQNGPIKDALTSLDALKQNFISRLEQRATKSAEPTEGAPID
jgi:methyl-accepting chemotaxis protein